MILKEIPMMETNEITDYRISQKVVHWLMAFFIILDLFVAQKFGGVMEEADRIESRSDHASVGLIIAALLVIRIYLRLRHGAPVLPSKMPPWQQRLAHGVHFVFYLLLVAMIATGVATAMNADSIISPFGLFAYGDGSGSEDTFLTIRAIHEFITDAMIALILLHVVAALYHLIIVRDEAGVRMLRFWKST